ncbi:MAG: hypothetical protein M5R36_03040 [Deltaproteobacteria bacterium]|nr:hypothetical protein [Deltaproteobacteria bacterium]
MRCRTPDYNDCGNALYVYYGGGYEDDVTYADLAFPAGVMDADYNIHFSGFLGSTYQSDLCYLRPEINYWDLEIIWDGMKASYPTIVAEPSGRSHISYWFSNNSPFRYARNGGRSWRREVIETGGDIGRTNVSAIELDRFGQPQVLLSLHYSGLVLAHKGLGDWALDPPFDSAAIEFSVAADSDGFLHALYNKFSGPTRYATDRSGAWFIETFDHRVGEGTWRSAQTAPCTSAT